MIIRKQFKFEGSHIVRCCSSDRCAQSIHGHSYIVEVFLQSVQLDNAGMVVDFGLLYPLKEFVDMFDHTHLLWNKDRKGYRDFIKENFARWIELDRNPSAENLAIIFHYYFDQLLHKMELHNGESLIFVKSVRVHETATGYAETEERDNTRLKKGQGIVEMSYQLTQSKGAEFIDTTTIYPPDPIQRLNEFNKE